MYDWSGLNVIGEYIIGYILGETGLQLLWLL